MSLTAKLAALYSTMSTLFNKQFASVPSHWQKVAMRIPTTAASVTYAWMSDMPGMREWLGDRVVHRLGQHSMELRNKDYELTISVKKNDIEDDQYGIYAPTVELMGYNSAILPDQLIFALMLSGFTTMCYDGQYFFDTDHPLGDTTASNYQAGASTPWFMLDTTKPIKPFVFQDRQKAQFVAKTKVDDDNVFMRKEFIYGVDARCAAGFGLWQLAHGSKAELSAANYASVRESMMSLKNSEGIPMNITPNLLVVPPSLETAAKEILVNERDANGATNTHRNTAELLVCPWLA